MDGDDRKACLEICADSPGGVAAAISGGADRIELCSALELGGLTPSAGLVVAARELTAAAGVALFAMVHPRAGDFAYAHDDVALAGEEARALIAQGVDGLVFGAVRDGRVDEAVARAWLTVVRDAAGARIPCTFHRAIDVTDDPVAAVAVVAALGFDRLLTSGGAIRAPDGAETIRSMVLQTDGSPLTIMAGSGVTPGNAAALLAATGVRELHASASLVADDGDERLLELGFARGPTRRTDAAIVGALRSVLDNSTKISH